MTRTPALERRFGDQGWTAIVNRLDGQMIRAIPDRPVAALDLPVRRMSSSRGSLTLKTRDSRIVTSWISLDRPGWLVVAAGSVDEFAGPFVRQRLVDLALLAGVVALVALAFTWLVPPRNTTPRRTDDGGRSNWRVTCPLSCRSRVPTRSAASPGPSAR
jgi:hypothetical protein